MSIKLDWLLEAPLIYQQSSGYLTLEEILLADQQLFSMLDLTEKNSICLLHDAQQLQGIRTGIPSLIREIRSAKHPQLSCVIHIGHAKPVLRPILTTIITSFGIQRYQVKDIEAAILLASKLQSHKLLP